MAELKIGNPEDFCTDIGPVINKQAKQMLDQHIKKMNNNAKLIFKTKIHSLENGYYISPHLYGSIILVS